MPNSQAVREQRRNSGQGGAPKEGQQRARTAESATLEDQCHPRKIFVGGLPHKTTTQQLREHFSQFGTIVDAVVLRWPDGRSRGFGYATFTTAAAAAAVLSQTHRIGGRQIDTKRAVPGTNKLFVGGLPQNCAATELRVHFEAFGVVSDAVVMIDPATNRSRGFGFVCFLPGQEGAAAVVAALERYDHHRIRGKWIEVKSAVSPHKLAASDSGQDSCGDSEAASEQALSPLALPGATEAFIPHPAAVRTPEMTASFGAPAVKPCVMFGTPAVRPAAASAPTAKAARASKVPAARPTPKPVVTEPVMYELGKPELVAYEPRKAEPVTCAAQKAESAMYEPRKVELHSSLPCNTTAAAGAAAKEATQQGMPAIARRSRMSLPAYSPNKAAQEKPAVSAGYMLSLQEASSLITMPEKASEAAPLSPLGSGPSTGLDGAQPGSGASGVFSTSESLQKSLEQLLRQQSLRRMAEESQVCGQDTETAVV